MKEKIKTNLGEDEITLAPPTELFDEAKEIAETTTSDQKFPFDIQYNVEQKEFLLSMLQTVGAVVEAEDEKGHTLSTMMNMTQLAFIKRLDCVERVKTDEGTHNPFLAGEGVATETESAPRATVLTLHASEMTAQADAVATSDEVASVASVGSRSFSNTDMASAQEIEVEKTISSRICCPGAKKWFKFTVPETAQYTIYTTGLLDTTGTLYDSNGTQLEEVNNYAPCGKLNFRIIRTLTAGATHYVKVTAANDTTGNYNIKITRDQLVESVSINFNSIALELGKFYELPILPGTFVNAYGSTASNLVANVVPATATEKKVTWSSSNSNILKIEDDWYHGQRYQTLKVVGSGTAKLYAYDWNEDGKRGECTVNVNQVASIKEINSISLSGVKSSMEVGDCEQLVATITPSDATIPCLEWESSNRSVATVNSFGHVEAIAPGTATIRAKAMDGSGVYGCCEVTCSTLSSGTDSIGVFQPLSMLSAAPADAETEAPVILGAQFSEPQGGKYNIRFVSQIKTLNYQSVGYEIHSKFGDADSVADIICSKTVYSALLADGQKIYPDNGFKFFVVGVVENVPQNAVASFKIVPFAITLEGEFLYGSETPFSCQNAQKINSVSVEMPENLSASDLIRVNTGNGSNLNVMSKPSENGTVLGQFANGENLVLVLEPPQNEKWYAVYGKAIDSTYKFGWCSGKYLQAQVVFIKSKYSGTLNIRPEPNTNYHKLGYIEKDERVRLLERNIRQENPTQLWNKIEYLGIEAYVVEDGDFVDCKDWGYLIESSSGYDLFLEALAANESSNRYNAVLGSHLGKYQMGDSALTDAGFKTDGTWSSLANYYGINNKTSFLSSHQGQEVAIRLFHAELWKQLVNHGAESVIEDNYRGVTITKSGLLAAAHLVGASGLMSAIRDNREIADANGTKATRYMSELMGYDISEIVHKK